METTQKVGRPPPSCDPRQTGRLRKSIRIRRATFRRITIAAEAPYAAAHNFGVDETVTVRSHTRHMQLPQRQFMGDSQMLDQKLDRIVERAVEEIFDI